MTKKIFLINAINIIHTSNSISVEHCVDHFKFAEYSIGLSPFINSNLELIGNASIQSNYFEYINGFVNAEYSRSKSFNLMAGLSFSYSRFNILIGTSLKKEIYFQIKAKLINRKYEILDKFSIAYTFHKNDTASKPDKTILKLDPESIVASKQQTKKTPLAKTKKKKALKTNNTPTKSQTINNQTLSKSQNTLPSSEEDKAKLEDRKKQKVIKELFTCKNIIYLYSNSSLKKTNAIRIFYKVPEQLNLLKQMDKAINYVYFNQKQKPFNGRIITDAMAKKEWTLAIKRINDITNNGKNQDQAMQMIFNNFSELMDHSLNTKDTKIIPMLKNNKNFEHIDFETETMIYRLSKTKQDMIKEAMYKTLDKCLRKMRQLNSIYKQEQN